MTTTNVLASFGLGAGLMYLFDPELGRRRRKMLLDQVNHAICEVSCEADTAWRDLRNRSYGAFAEMRSMISEHDNSDKTLCARVRSKLGRCTSHPSAICVSAQDGQLTLSGPILSHEVQQVVRTVKHVPGVKGVENQLEVHEASENFPALQGGKATGEQFELAQRNWSPGTRLLAGGAGLALMTCCTASRSPSSMLLGTIGFALAGRAFFGQGNRPGSGAQRSRRTSSGADHNGHHEQPAQTHETESGVEWPSVAT